VQKNDWRTVDRPRFGVADIQESGVDLFQRGERHIRPQSGATELGGGKSHGRSTQKAAAAMVDGFTHYRNDLNAARRSDTRS
jgi:hypothetical protein